MSIRPLYDRVAIKPIAQEGKTAGGIIIPDTAKEKPMRGEIIAVGSGTKSDNGTIIPLEVKLGDIVLFGKWGGTEIKFDGHDLVIMKESDILAIIK
jgi:chaperonin GroES